MIPIHHKIAGAIKSFGLQAQWVPPSLSKVEAKFYIEYRMAARLNPQSLIIAKRYLTSEHSFSRCSILLCPTVTKITLSAFCLEVGTWKRDLEDLVIVIWSTISPQVLVGGMALGPSPMVKWCSPSKSSERDRILPVVSYADFFQKKVF